MDEWSARQFHKALEVAVKSYSGLDDKAGLPIIFHAMAVAKPMLEEFGIKHGIVGLLHDAYENPWNTEEEFVELEELLGSEIATAVRAITKRKGENYLNEYIPRCFLNPIAKAVKVRDLKNNYGNCSNIPNPSDRARLSLKYAKALEIAGE